MATNTDATFPTPHGLEPGAGALVAYLEVGFGPESRGRRQAPPDLPRTSCDPGSEPPGWWSETGPTPMACLPQLLGAPFALVLSGVTRRERPAGLARNRRWWRRTWRRSSRARLGRLRSADLPLRCELLQAARTTSGYMVHGTRRQVQEVPGSRRRLPGGGPGQGRGVPPGAGQGRRHHPEADPGRRRRARRGQSQGHRADRRLHPQGDQLTAGPDWPRQPGGPGGPRPPHDRPGRPQVRPAGFGRAGPGRADVAPAESVSPAEGVAAAKKAAPAKKAGRRPKKAAPAEEGRAGEEGQRRPRRPRRPKKTAAAKKAAPTKKAAAEDGHVG